MQHAQRDFLFPGAEAPVPEAATDSVGVSALAAT